MTNAEAWFSIALSPRKPEGSLGRTAQDGHLDSYTAPELLRLAWIPLLYSIPLPGLMTLFQGQRRVRKENFKLCFLKVVVQCSFKIVLWLHTKKIMHSIMCLTGLCLMEIKKIYIVFWGFFFCCFLSFLGYATHLKQ